jgi:presequence protease
MLRLQRRLAKYANVSTRRLSTIAATQTDSSIPITTPPPPPTEHTSFDIIKSVDLREDLGDVTATLYKHRSTGAEVLSMRSSDSNKVFGVTFGTPPDSSNGVAHILEHSVLCGGKKYPLKEPFVELLKGSMNTFLNAFTYPDRTCYPVASTNLKDFYNLIDVYLDAVFFPNITELTFKQEGWHLAPDDNDSNKLIYRGVVFNEMKGVYSQPDSLVHRHMSHAMYPDPKYIYGVDSGGDPAHIPDLSYDEFVNFHKTYYRPSNARIFFFGDDPEDERLRLVEETIRNLMIEDPDRCGPLPKPKPPIRPLSDGPGLNLKIPYATEDVDENENQQAEIGQHYAMSGWILNEKPFDLEESITLSIANDLLVGNASSTLYRDLMDSKLGTAFIGGGLSDELQQTTFSVGLKGVHEKNCHLIDEIIEKSLKKAVHDGFPMEAIHSSVNSTEFSLLEFNTGGIPRGLSLMLAANPSWLYNDDPFMHLEMKKAMKKIKIKVNQGVPIFSNIVEKYLVNNTCKSTVELIPDPLLGKKQDMIEKAALNQIRLNITDMEHDQIIKDQQILLEHQNSTDSRDILNLIPRLNLSDLNQKISTTPRSVSVQEKNGNTNSTVVLVHELAETNGIVYVDVVLDANDVDMDSLMWLPMFTNAMTQTGTDKLDEASLTYEIGTHTGGLGASVLCTTVRDPEDRTKWSTEDSLNKIIIRGKATVEKVPLLFHLIGDVLLTSNIDNRDRLTEMIRSKKEESKSILLSSGHSVASNHLKSKLSKVNAIQEKMGGISVYEKIKSLDVDSDEEWNNINNHMHSLRKSIVNSSNILVNITSDAVGIMSAEACVSSFVDRLPERTKPTNIDNTLGKYKWEKKEKNMNEGFSVASQVNYVVQGGLLDLKSSQSSGGVSLGAASVISRYLRNTWLWDEVRVKGGAYGGFCSFDTVSNIFSYGSYRDPNLKNTLDIYSQSPEFLKSTELGEDEVTKGIIGTISDADSPRTPSGRGYTDMLRYLVDETDENRQMWRDQVLSTNENDFRNFGDMLQTFHDNRPNIVVIGGSGSVDEMKEEKNWSIRHI